MGFLVRYQEALCFKIVFLVRNSVRGKLRGQTQYLDIEKTL